MSVRTVAKGAVGFSRMVTGIYTGDGAATQAIIGVGFQPKHVIIYKRSTQVLGYDLGFKTDQDGANTKFHDYVTPTWQYAVDHIVSLDATGFTVGDGTGLANVFNINAQVYTYIAFG